MVFNINSRNLIGEVIIDHDWSDTSWDKPDTYVSFLGKDDQISVRWGRTYVDYGVDAPARYAGHFFAPFNNMIDKMWDDDY